MGIASTLDPALWEWLREYGERGVIAALLLTVVGLLVKGRISRNKSEGKQGAVTRRVIKITNPARLWLSVKGKINADDLAKIIRAAGGSGDDD
jgi:hypothetical protein